MHDRAPRIGVLLVNLGTPDAPTPAAVRRYLAEFLSDPRVVEIPPAIWQPILHGVVLRTRPCPVGREVPEDLDRRRLAARRAFGEAAHAAARLSRPAAEEGRPAGRLLPGRDRHALRQSRRSTARSRSCCAANAERILVLPLYPQYAASTTASTFDRFAASLRRMRRIPGVRFVESFHDDPGYIRALAQNVNDYWVKNGRPRPAAAVVPRPPAADARPRRPYHCHCHKTARLVTDELGLDRKQWVLSFQSRFGRAEWLKPYTARDVCRRLPARASARVDVVCPGFVADCLETLEEIGIEGRDTFLKAGGKAFHAIPCLNEHPAWIARAGRPGVAAVAGLARRAARTPRPANTRCCGPRRSARPAKVRLEPYLPEISDVVQTLARPRRHLSALESLGYAPTVRGVTSCPTISNMQDNPTATSAPAENKVHGDKLENAVSGAMDGMPDDAPARGSRARPARTAPEGRGRGRRPEGRLHSGPRRSRECAQAIGRSTS